MIYKILTIFPEIYDSFLNSSIIARAISKGIIKVELINIRDYTKDKYKRIDTPPIGGGAGLIMKPQPIIDALQATKTENTYSIITSPRGKTFNQNMAKELSKKQEILIFCGHYEGFDERVYQYFDDCISIGDYILTGGETASFVLIDAISRLVPGVISEGSTAEESFNESLLEYPQFTEPYDFNGDKVPDILYTGNHKAIKNYRRYQQLLLTKNLRPDLFEKYNITKEDKKILESYNNEGCTKIEKEALKKGKKFLKN